MNIAFISCVKEKRIGKYKAKDLYTSDFFRKSFGYCSSKYDKVFTLSAKYGVLDLEEEIKNYEMTLNDFSKVQEVEWSVMVYNQLENKIDDSDNLYFYVGNNYREHLLPLLSNNCFVPLEGKGIGEQLQYFKNNTETQHEFF
mgnify:FL=1